MAKKLGPNDCEHLQNGTTVIHITRRNGTKYEVLIDTKDYKLVAGYRWWVLSHHSNNSFYAACWPYKVKRPIIYMHTLINNTPKGMETDHKDTDTLNNKRDNLRSATPSQNRSNTKTLRPQNSSGFQGVTKEGKRFVAQIHRMGKNSQHIGRYETKEEAAIAYDKEALALHGDFARLNFPENREQYLKEIYGEVA